ncbi:MAG: hypothetical protein EBU31_09925 [Proteobacteria bacterium]|nr:hypothetical protein [Pseudomonadota bacterium]
MGTHAGDGGRRRPRAHRRGASPRREGRPGERRVPGFIQRQHTGGKQVITATELPDDNQDPLIEQAVSIITQNVAAGVRFLQRTIGRERAATLIDQMLNAGTSGGGIHGGTTFNRAPAMPPKTGLNEAELRQIVAKFSRHQETPIEQAGTSAEGIPHTMDQSGYQFPSIDLLAEPTGNFSAEMESFVREQATKLNAALREFDIEGEIKQIDSGRSTTWSWPRARVVRGCRPWTTTWHASSRPRTSASSTTCWAAARSASRCRIPIASRCA